MSSAVCTLFEGDYHLGVGALVNSLYAHGFRGTVFAGYRGELPPWAKSVQHEGANAVFQVGDGLKICFQAITTKVHFANYKPHLIKALFDSDTSIQKIFYFDPDIVIKCRWSFYEEWVQDRVALVEEIATRGMPYNHPIRFRWLAIAKELGIVCRPTFSQYFNSGFVGLSRTCETFVDHWINIIEAMPKYGIDLSLWMPADRTHPFCGPDQDAMNIVAMAVEPCLSTIGPEGMDLIPGGFTMSHAVGGTKPWRKNYLLSALKGIKPMLADKAYWQNVASPIPVFSEPKVRRQRIMIKLASLVGRFYHQ